MLAELAQTQLGLTLSAEQAAAFDLYLRELLDWNARVNLTAITDPATIVVRHFLDSLTLARVLPPAADAAVIDVGAGAGFPGLALNIAFPELHVTLLEATGKKVSFLEHMIALLKLPNARAVKARAEDFGHLGLQRAGYQLVVARAVARLPALLEYLLPLATLGGQCVAMKGVTAQAEIDDSADALRILGGKLNRVETIQLPGVEDPHYLVVVDKVSPTPWAYPRKPGVPQHTPL